MRPLLVLLTLVASAAPALAQLRLAALFGDGAVIQHGVPLPVWGWATPGADVVVDFGGEEYETMAGLDGRWEVELPPLAPGGEYVIAVVSDGRTVVAEGLTAGDVWVAAGQSNMEWSVAEAQHAEAEIAAAADPDLRHFDVPRSWAETPQAELEGGPWHPADPEHAGRFSAVAYFFARDLRAAQPDSARVPIGLVNATWGGSRIEPWMRAEALGLAGPEAFLEQEAARERALADSIRARVGEIPDADPGLVDGDPRWAAPDFDDAGWATVPVPSAWERAGFDGMDGVGWYRTAFDLTADEAAAGITLGLGHIDDSDVAWVNGQEVGRMERAWDTPRVYPVPASALRAGRNVLAVRVEDYGGGGGIAGPAGTVFLSTEEGRRPLPETWRFAVGELWLGGDGSKNRVPTVLWNQMVHPLLPFPIAGVIWYQGESNAGRMEDALAYRDLFPRLIESWREEWDRPDLPFLWVQLASYHPPTDEPAPESLLALTREAQSAALRLPHTAEVVTLDVGDAFDIHPRDKQTVGRRLALAARHVAYGEDLSYSGPTYRSHEVDGSRVVVRFDHADGGLRSAGPRLGGFALAGADGVFHWAEARVDGDAVVLASDAVPDPVAVRYGWADNPVRATLVNGAGLPAAPFRTDWP